MTFIRTQRAALAGLAVQASSRLAAAQDAGPGDWQRTIASATGQAGAEQPGGVYRVPLQASIDVAVTVLAIAAAVALFYMKFGVIGTLVACSIAGLALRFALGSLL